MDLKAYIRERGRADLAKALKTSPAYVSQLAYGQRRVTGEMAVKIERATDSDVTRVELRPDLFHRESEAA